MKLLRLVLFGSNLFHLNQIKMTNVHKHGLILMSFIPLVLAHKTTGAPPHPINYRIISFNGKEYAVCVINSILGDIPFVIDANKLPVICEYPSWHVTANNYISTSVIVDGKKKSLYLHNLIMGKKTFEGKGQLTTVDHINQNGFDNRIENLRIITQTEQNLNQRKKKRTVVLPSDIGIDANELPKHIWYIKPSCGHGDRFCIQLHTEGITWKTTSSKSISTIEKLQQAKAKLAELYIEYPHLNPDNPEIVEQKEGLNSSLQEIINLAMTS